MPPAKKHLVPAQPVRFLVQKWAKLQPNLSTAKDQAGELARLTGLERESVRKLILGHRKNVDFDVADKLLCAMGMPEEWYGTMAPFYFGPGETMPDYFPGLCRFLTDTDYHALKEAYAATSI